MMSVLDHVKTIGDTTQGSSGNPQEYSLEDGTQYTISSWVAHRADQTAFEDIGLFPDIPIPASESIVNNHDRVLEKAIEILE
jgi:C-terminal processing protease CtpA/Prc